MIIVVFFVAQNTAVNPLLKIFFLVEIWSSHLFKEIFKKLHI